MDKDELQILSNVLCDKDGFKFIFLLLKKLGAFERGLNFELPDKQLFTTLAKREQGIWLLDNIYKANPEKYNSILAKENGNE